MTLLKNVVRHGNGHAMVLSPDVMRLHGIDPATTKIQVATTGESIVLTPVRPKYDAAFDKAFKAVFRKHHNTLLALSQE